MTKKVLLLIALCLPLMSISYAAKLSFSGADTMIKNCPSQIEVYLDTQGEEIGTAGVNIVLNEDEFIVNKFETENGIFRTYPAPKILEARKDNFKGKEFLRLIGTTSSVNGFMGEGSFGTLTITPRSDKLSLDFYMIPGYDGEDSNLSLNTNGNITDALTEIENKVISVVEGDCSVVELAEIEITDTESSIFVAETQYKVEDSLDINEENIFDATQENNRFKRNINYITIAIALLIIVLIILLSRKKKNKKEKKEKRRK